MQDKLTVLSVASPWGKHLRISMHASVSALSINEIVAGLGNPSSKEYGTYPPTIWDLDVIDELARRWSVNVWKRDRKAEIASVVRFGERSFW